jgi:4'-phosphopantetheinyl transferase
VVEADRPIGAIAEHVLGPEEKEILASVPEPHRRSAFYRIWTQKEAVAKGLGLGVQLPFDGFAVSPEGGPVRFSADPFEEPKWFSVAIEAAPDLILSLATARRPPQVRLSLDSSFALLGTSHQGGRRAPAYA